MSESSTGGLASIIVPCSNEWKITRLCLKALFRHTRRPWELIVVDDGSTDETAGYLAGVQDLSPVPVTLITHTEKRGLSAATNEGLKAARGEFLVLVHNDAVVTDAWLDQLIALSMARVDDHDPALEHQPGSRSGGVRIGLVGPMSNDAPPPQHVEQVTYRCLDEMQTFARRWRDQHRGKWLRVSKLSDFCVLMTRQAYNETRGPDESSVPAISAFDDLTMRAARAGFALAVARDLFVHHFGGGTSAVDRNVPVGRRRVAGPRAERWHSEMQVSPGPGDEGKRTSRVSLTMIVRDEEENLPLCLASVRGVFDEIVVLDTGSVDRTREIAREFGARIFEFPWIDDFAAARNTALEHATGDYAFWLDADDVVETPERWKLVTLLDGLRPADEAGYVARCACDPGGDGSGGLTVVDHIRLFPLRPDVRWSYRVHEQIMPALRRARIPVRWTDLVVRHTGYADVALRARKLDRDARILQEELKDRPDEPFILFNLGSIAVERKDWRAALDYLGRSLRLSAPGDSITRKLFALIARAHQMLDDTSAALRVCSEGLALDPEDAELWFRRAAVHRQRGEPSEAEACWRRILGLKRPEKFASVDMGIYGHLTRRNLAALAAERGDHEEEARLWRAVLAECPGDREAAARLRREAVRSDA